MHTPNISFIHPSILWVYLCLLKHAIFRSHLNTLHAERYSTAYHYGSHCQRIQRSTQPYVNVPLILLTHPNSVETLREQERAQGEYDIVRFHPAEIQLKKQVLSTKWISLAPCDINTWLVLKKWLWSRAYKSKKYYPEYGGGGGGAAEEEANFNTSLYLNWDLLLPWWVI